MHPCPSARMHQSNPLQTQPMRHTHAAFQGINTDNGGSIMNILLGIPNAIWSTAKTLDWNGTVKHMDGDTPCSVLLVDSAYACVRITQECHSMMQRIMPQPMERTCMCVLVTTQFNVVSYQHEIAAGNQESWIQNHIITPIIAQNIYIYIYIKSDT